jgi:hypothetical protein
MRYQMVLTRQMVLRGRGPRGGWTRKQLALIGVSWPPPKGWLDQLAARRQLIDGQTLDEFYMAAKTR